MSAGDVAVTLAPGRMAPWASVTSPVIRPGVICADAGAAYKPTIANRTSAAALDLIWSSGNECWGRYVREILTTPSTGNRTVSVSLYTFYVPDPAGPRSLGHHNRPEL